MAVKQCPKCGEQTDEAKAFCPQCGHAFVAEEQRKTPSEFEQMDSTVQLGQTMYNQMLSDLGLNISKAPDRPVRKAVDLTPASAMPAEKKPSESAKSEGQKWWWIIGGILAAVVAAVVIAAAVALWFFYR